MPTHDELAQFLREYRALPKDRRDRFREAVAAMNEDLKAKRPFRRSLRVSVLGGQSNIYEMTWEMPNGRATFTFGAERIPGEPHIIWRRIGGHEIYGNP